MKTFVAIFLVAALSFALGQFLPWWSVAVAAFAVSLLMSRNPLHAFLIGFTGVFLFWAAYAFLIDMANESILSRRVAFLLPLQGNSMLLVLVSGVIGGICGGLAATCANFLTTSGRPRYDHQNYYRKKFR